MNINALMQQAQKMQEQMQVKMQKAQEELAKTEIVGESGAGLVKITMTGKYDVKRVVIAPDLLQEDKEVLEDLIAAAVNDATLGLHTWSDPRRVGPYNPRAWVWKDGRIDHRTGFRLEECLSARTIQISDVADIAAFVRQLIGS